MCAEGLFSGNALTQPRSRIGRIVEFSAGVDEHNKFLPRICGNNKFILPQLLQFLLTSVPIVLFYNWGLQRGHFENHQGKCHVDRAIGWGRRILGP